MNSIVALLLSGLSPQAAQAGPSVPCPFPASAQRQGPEQVELWLDEVGVGQLRGSRRLVLTGIPWSAGLDLDLRRCPDPILPGTLHVDGFPVGGSSIEDATFWSGTVLGEASSDVFLAFAGGALWGWIQRPGELVHVLSVPGKRERARVRTVLVSEAALIARGLAFKPVCATETRPLTTPHLSAPRVAGFPLLRATLAVETDFQFFQLFGDLALAEGYVGALLAAANVRLEQQIGLRLETSRVAFYTTPADPWQAQDSAGSNCLDLLYEFQAAWMNGAGPVPSDLHHFMSGVDLGCGAGFIDALCDPERGFSVMSRMDGQTPFPVNVSPLNWDFVFVCHEIGHNLGSVHTHEYCPPLDECSPAGLWGPCQDEQRCTSSGTFMSYCHACPGGLTNFTTWFHPVVAATMRQAVLTSCLPSVPRR